MLTTPLGELLPFTSSFQEAFQSGAAEPAQASHGQSKFVPTEEVQAGGDPECSPITASNFLCDMSIHQLISHLLCALIYRVHSWLKLHKFPKTKNKIKSHRTNYS